MKIITATLASLSLALGLAAPTTASAADSEDIAKIIAGIATIAVIAEIADRKRERDRAKSSARTTQDVRHRWERDDWRRDDWRRDDWRRDSWGRIDGGRHGPKAGRGYKALPLPASCERVVETRRGDRLVYGARCLDRRYKHADKLPQGCRVLVDTRRGDRLAYGARCLRRDGWQVARR